MAPSKYKSQPIRFFVIDRLAAGFSDDEVCSMFRNFFETQETDEEILLLAKDSGPDIEMRRAEIVSDIKRSDLTGILLRHIQRLDEKSNSVEDIRALTNLSVAIGSLVSAARPRNPPVQIQSQVNIISAAPINAKFLEDLVNDGVLAVASEAKSKKLFGSLPAIPAVTLPAAAVIDTHPGGGEAHPETKKEEDIEAYV